MIVANNIADLLQGGFDWLGTFDKGLYMFNNPDFDYPKLGEKIASFEVNGFLNKDEITPFRNLVDKFNHIDRRVALVCAALFIVVALFSNSKLL